MFTVKLTLIQKLADFPMHFIGRFCNSTSRFTSGRFNNCDSLSQYFVVFRLVMNGDYCFHMG